MKWTINGNNSTIETAFYWYIYLDSGSWKNDGGCASVVLSPWYSPRWKERKVGCKDVSCVSVCVGSHATMSNSDKVGSQSRERRRPKLLLLLLLLLSPRCRLARQPFLALDKSVDTQTYTSEETLPANRQAKRREKRREQKKKNGDDDVMTMYIDSLCPPRSNRR